MGYIYLCIEGAYLGDGLRLLYELHKPCYNYSTPYMKSTGSDLKQLFILLTLTEVSCHHLLVVYFMY